MASSVGVCVTGEARAFSLHGVRDSLRQLLQQFDQPTVRFILARRGSASCSGNVYRESPKLCYLAEHSFFGMPLRELQRDFPSANMTITHQSSCAVQPARAEPCCRPYQSVGSIGEPRREPGSFLQHFAILRCVRDVLADAASRGKILSHVIRTRPDAVYLDPAGIARAVLGLNESTFAMHRRSSGSGSDIFMAAPASAAASFFGAAPATMTAQCNQSTGASTHMDSTGGTVPRAAPGGTVPSGTANTALARSKAPEALVVSGNRDRRIITPTLPVVIINVLGQPSGCVSQPNVSACQALASRIAHAPQPPLRVGRGVGASGAPEGPRDSAERIASVWATDRLGQSHGAAKRDHQLRQHAWSSIIALVNSTENFGF